MLDGVDHGFFEGEADAENIVFAVVVGSQVGLDHVLDAPGFGRVAVDHNVLGMLGSCVAHGVRLAQYD
jgi:hypothetical protein